LQGSRCLRACMHDDDRRPAASLGARRGALGRCAWEGMGGAPRMRRPGGAPSSPRCAARRTRAAPASTRHPREVRPRNILFPAWRAAAVGCWLQAADWPHNPKAHTLVDAAGQQGSKVFCRMHGLQVPQAGRGRGGRTPPSVCAVRLLTKCTTTLRKSPMCRSS